MGEFIAAAPAQPADPNWRWYRELTRYHWFVLTVAALGWIFDCLDQQLFNLARVPAMKELVKATYGAAATQADVDLWGGISTAVFMVGWATGGILFGIMGDRIGRAKTMLWTISIYSFCTGLSALSRTVWDFGLYRFLTGLGVGGEFAVGVALVAEVMPDRARPFTLGLLQALSTVGNVSAALISMSLAELEDSGVLGSVNLFGFEMNQWRAMFLIGTLPSLLAILVRARLREPERWTAAITTDTKHKAGSLAELFGDPRWRKRAIVGMLLASVGVIGLWGIGFFSLDLNRSVFTGTFDRDARTAGLAIHDQAFLRSLFATPGGVAAVAGMEPKTKLAPNDLLSLSPDNKDPQILLATAFKLHDNGQSVTAGAVLEALDQGDPLADRKPQTAEDQTRRADYLSGGTPADIASLTSQAEEIAKRAKDMRKSVSMWAGITSLMFNVGAFFGVYAFSYFTFRYGRKPAFAVAFIAAMISTAGVFWFIDRPSDVFWMTPVMGFFQISLFGGYAIYFPELFPTRLRSTGTSFCYNVGRYIAAAGPLTLGLLASKVFQDTHEPLRWAGISMCSVFLIGLAVLPFAPETKGHPLPE